MSDRMTTKGGFIKECTDITHKPKRFQNDQIAKSLTLEDSGEDSSKENLGDSFVPKVVTLERAIKFYEANATGEFVKLYKQTALWLRDILQKKV